MSNLDTLRTILSNDLVAKWINLRDYALDTLSANPVIKELMDESDKKIEPLVPVMTSNTTPEGTAIRSAAYNTNSEAYKAFDGEQYTNWMTPAGATNNYVGYSFVNPVIASKVKILALYSHGSGQNPLRSFVIQGSNDGFTSDIHDLGTFDATPHTSGEFETIDVELTGSVAYSSLRIFCSDTLHVSGTWSICVAELQFYGYKQILMPLVPTMTSNTTPKGECIISYPDGRAIYDAFHAFDGDATTYIGFSTHTPITDVYSGYDFKEPKLVKGWSLTANSDALPRISTLYLKASNDLSTWETLGSWTPSDNGNILTINNNTEYRYYCAFLGALTGTYRSDQIAWHTLQFYTYAPQSKYGYGEWALMPQVPKMTSNTAPYGVASASSVNATGFEAYRAFDGIQGTPNSNRWSSDGGDANKWLQYKFIEAKKIAKVIVYPYRDMDTTIVVKGSNDGSTFTDLATLTFTADGSGGQDYSKAYPIDIPEDKQASYMYYRLAFTVPSGRSAVVGELQFYAWQPKGNVPIMTSDTAPYGVASASSERDSTHGAFAAFNGDDTTGWLAAGTSLTGWVQYKFPNPVNVRKARIAITPSQNWSQYFNSLTISASNDGSTFTELWTMDVSSDTDREKIPEINNDDYYLYYRLTVNCKSAAGYAYIHELQFYGRELSVSVPTMTSNTAPYGVASASSILTNDFPAWKVFDGSASSDWFSGANANDEYLQYDFPNATSIRMVVILPVYGTSGGVYYNHLKTFSIKASNDGIDFDTTLLPLQTLANSNPGTLVYSFSNPQSFKHYRIANMTTHVPNGAAGIYTLQFYGLDYSEREFAEGSTMKYIYDHGVELEELTFGTLGSGTTSYEKEPSEVVLIDGSSSQKLYMFGGQVDFSNYSIERAIIGDKFTYSEVSAEIAVYNSNVASDNIIRLSYSNPQYGNPSAVLDVSAISQTAYPCICPSHQAGTGTISIKEWWLE